MRVEKGIPLAVVTVMILVSLVTAKKVKTEADCEVCVKFLTKFQDSLSSDEKSSPDSIKEAFMKYCKNARNKDERFCYYVGGLETSATSTVNDISRPLSYSKPVIKICEAINTKDEQICELKYDKEIDLTKVNLKKLKVKDLKKILSDWNEDCRGCAEKSDFIRKIEDLMPKYAPEAAKARKTEL